jgi:hypothetical protein
MHMYMSVRTSEAGMMTWADSELLVLARGWSISTMERTTLFEACVCLLVGICVYGANHTRTHTYIYMYTHT